MKRTPRVLAAVVAATALTFTGAHTADAKPDRAGTHAKAEKSAKAEKAAKAKSGKDSEAKLIRDKARLQARLDKATSEKRLENLDEADRNAIDVSVESDKTALAGVETRADLRQFRVENYRLVVNVLRKAAKLRAAATEAGEAGVDASAAMPAEVFAAVATITAQTAKADTKPILKAARLALADASALLDTEDDEDTSLVAPVTPEGDGVGGDGSSVTEDDEDTTS